MSSPLQEKNRPDEGQGELVPEQEKGKSVDLEHSVSFDDPAAAGRCFRTARHRLLTPALWKDLAGGGARFRLRAPFALMGSAITL